jgi:hypothetical protein
MLSPTNARKRGRPAKNAVEEDQEEGVEGHKKKIKMETGELDYDSV